MEETTFDTDLEDEEEEKDRRLPALSFEKKLTVHRTNRLNELFGQMTILPSIRCHSPSNAAGRIRRYEKNCQMLDINVDWQLRAMLSYDNITILNRSFSFHDFQAFTNAMETNLRSLTLNSVGLTVYSWDLLCQGLSQCIHIYRLDLSYNKIDKKNFNRLMEMINQFPLLLYLSLAECGISDSYGRRIGDLCRHKRVKELNISGNELEEMSCILLSNGLTENTSLTSLNLSWNWIRSFASLALFRGFEVNKTLTDFDLSWSDLGYDGSVALRRTLIVNKVLQNLNLSNCNIDWTCAKLISEGLKKNSTLKTINLSFNPLTTHGVQYIVQALTTRKSAVTVLDLSGLIVFSSTLRLAENLAQRRNFIMKYDFETPVHDFLGRKHVTKADSRRLLIEHIDQRNWRALDYFRMVENKRKLQGQTNTTMRRTSKFQAEYGDDTIENLQQHLMGRVIQPFTYKNLTTVIHLQRMRNRLRKARVSRQEKELEERNQKILQTVNQHFPNIDIISRQERHKQAIEHLAKPRLFPETKLHSIP